MPRKRKTTTPRLKRVSIKAERHSEPDWDRFAWALLQHARLVAGRPAQQLPKRRPEP